MRILPQILLVTGSFIFIRGCIRPIDIPTHQYEAKLREDQKYKVTDRGVRAFLGLDISDSNMYKLKSWITVNKLHSAHLVCKDLRNAIPQVWDTIGKLYRIPNGWYIDSTRCTYDTGTNRIEQFKMKCLSKWSQEITGEDEGQYWLKHLRHIHKSVSKYHRYRLKVSAIISANLHYNTNGNIDMVQYSIDCDYYLKYCFGNQRCAKGWDSIPFDEINMEMISATTKDIQQLIVRKYAQPTLTIK
jgi:hypothetical protein